MTRGSCHALQTLHAFCKARGYDVAPDSVVNVSASGPAMTITVWDGTIQPLTMKEVGDLQQSEFAKLYSVRSCRLHVVLWTWLILLHLHKTQSARNPPFANLPFIRAPTFLWQFLLQSVASAVHFSLHGCGCTIVVQWRPITKELAEGQV